MNDDAGVLQIVAIRSGNHNVFATGGWRSNLITCISSFPISGTILKYIFYVKYF